MIQEEESDNDQSENIHSSVLECPHEYVTANGVCAGCGTTYACWNQKNKTYYSKGSHLITKSSDKSILQDLAKYNFTDDIKHKANSIFQEIGAPTKRGKERDKMLFYLVYTTFREKGICVDPRDLGKEMNLSTGDINRAMTTFSEAQTGYRPKINLVSPIDVLPGLCSNLDLDCISEEVLEIGRDVMKKCPNLQQEFPHKVAAGILSYFMEINGIKIPPEIFRSKVNLSDVTIKDIHKRITEIHNQ